MKTNQFMKFVFGIALMGLIWPAQGQFVAVNDHESGPGTSANTTRYNVLGAEDGTNGPLKNVQTGTTLPVILNISRTGTVNVDPSGNVPAPNTPLANEFNGFVDFNGSAQNNAGVLGTATVTYRFSGLNPSQKYYLLGGGVRGSSNFTNRWTRFELAGSTAFIPVHSPGVLTSTEVPASIAANQAAINLGANHTPETGYIFQWQDINPGSDGIIELIVTRYGGAVPGGTSGGGVPVAYIPTAIKLIEAVVTPITIITHPQSQSTTLGGSVIFTVAATGFPINYQWQRDGVNIPGATGPSYVIPSITAGDSGPQFRVVLSNQFGTVTSRAALVVIPKDPITILPWGNTYRYLTNATDQGVVWRQPGFNDSTWQSGPGPLGDEGSALPVPFGTPFSRIVPNLTYYFRTKFVLNDPPGDFSLVVTNMLDDGAVFYLNGTEIYRVGMSTAEPTFTTTANRTVGNAALETILNVPTDLLVLGTNTLAVEAHQVNGTSSDIVMGTRWVAIFPTPAPIVITQEPQDLLVEETKEAVFSVAVSGSNPRYQWLHNGNPIAGADRSTFTITNTTLASAGNYEVSVGNAFGIAVSRIAVLTIFADTNAPTLLDADGTKMSTMVELTFSEVVHPREATNIANYVMTNTTTGSAIPITRAYMTNRTTVVLLSAIARSANLNYILRVSKVYDIAAATNVIIANSGIPVSTKLSLQPFDADWDFYDPFVPYEPADLGTAWRQPGFVPDGSWGRGRKGALANGMPEAPVPVNSALGNFESITSYFLSKFVYTGSPLGAVVTMQYAMDDGAVVYFNYEELLRINMPDGTILFDTPSATPVGVPSREEYVLPFNTLKFGTNNIAVEVHQDQALSVDKLMGLELVARIDSLVTGPIVITSGPDSATANENGSVSFRVRGAGPRSFQWFVNNVAVPGATDPVLIINPVPLSFNNALIRVDLTSPTETKASTNAVLKVVPDGMAPALVSAQSDDTLNRVVVTFTEAVSAATAGLKANYALTNAAGQTIVINTVTILNPTTVQLNTDILPRGGAGLVVNNVRDTAVTPNVIRPNSVVTVGFQGVLLPWSGVWKYNQDAVDLESDWRFAQYDDAAWLSGASVLGFPVGEALPGGLSVTTALIRLTTNDPPVYIVTSYFRHALNIPGGIGGTVTVRNVIDDGAVFYVNGVEAARIGMPTTAVTWATAASRANDVTSAGHGIETITIPGSRFVSGLNMLAVELHQGGGNSSDLIFGSEWSVTVPSIVDTPVALSCPDLTVTRAGGMVRLTWPSSSTCKLQSTDQLRVNPAQTVWTDVTVTTPGVYQTTPTTPAKYYRLSQ